MLNVIDFSVEYIRALLVSYDGVQWEAPFVRRAYERSPAFKQGRRRPVIMPPASVE
jgi:hypothetical protein